MDEEPTPLDFLKAVYLNEGLPLTVRMRAATEAAPYMHAKLGAMAITSMSSNDFAAALDRAIARSGKAPLLIEVRSLADAWADTTTPHGKLMITILGGLAEFERSLILARTSEGRTRAKARGVRFGRKPALTAHQQAEALARRAAGEACTAIARSYAVSHSTISRLA